MVISKSFDNHDIIYKKIIAEAVFNGDSKNFAIQSKIAQQSLETHHLKGKPIITGNLIFADNKIKKNLSHLQIQVRSSEHTHMHTHIDTYIHTHSYIHI